MNYFIKNPLEYSNKETTSIQLSGASLSIIMTPIESSSGCRIQIVDLDCPPWIYPSLNTSHTIPVELINS
jgi:hypothetical protein